MAVVTMSASLAFVSSSATSLESLILRFLPYVLFFGVLPLLFYHHFHDPAPALAPGRRSVFSWARLIFSTALLIAQLVEISLTWLSSSTESTGAATAEPIEVLLAAANLAMAFMDHNRAARPASIVVPYLKSAIILDAAKIVWFYRQGKSFLGSITIIVSVVRFVLMKVNIILRRDGPHADTALGGFRVPSMPTKQSWEFVVFFFTSGIFGSLPRGDIHVESSCKQSCSELRQSWELMDKTARNSLASACAEAWKDLAVALFALKTLSAVLTFAEPFALYHILLAVSDAEASTHRKVSCLASYLGVFVFKMIAKDAQARAQRLLLTKLRGGLLSVLYDKSQLLTVADAPKHLAVPLVDSAINDIVTGAGQIYGCIFGFLETAFGMSLLSFFIGAASLGLAIPIVLTIIGVRLLAKHSRTLQQQWGAAAEERMSKTSKILSQYSATRMIGLGSKVNASLQSLFISELKSFTEFFNLLNNGALYMFAIKMLSPPIIIGIATFSNSFVRGISAPTIFTTLYLLFLSLWQLDHVVPAFALCLDMLRGFERIHDYLTLDERQDYRTDLASTTNYAGFAIQFEQVLYASLPSATPFFSESSFTLAEGSVTLLIGASGVGKSTMLKCMLGEAHLQQGSVSTNTAVVGYCAQTVWLQNGSVRQNIIGLLPYDAQRYALVVECCLLGADLEQLPGKDLYIVNNGGLNLSGGQRHRIAIARMVYSQASIMLFDDVFSALDRRTAVSILLRLFGQEGLLRRMGCTVVLTTYLAESLDFVDNALFLNKETRRIILRANDGHLELNGFLRAHHVSAPEVVEERQQATVRRKLDREQQNPNDASQGIPQAAKTKKPWVVSFFNGRKGKVNLLVFWILCLFGCCMERLGDVYMRVWLAAQPSDDLYFPVYILSTLLAIAAHRPYTWFIFEYFWPRAALTAYNHLLGALARATVGFLDNAESSVVLGQFTIHLNRLTRICPYNLFQISYMTLSSLTYFAIISLGIKYGFFTLPFVMLSLAVIFGALFRKAKQMGENNLSAKKSLFAVFEDASNGLDHIRAFGWQAFSRERFFRLADESQRYHLAQMHVMHWSDQAVSMVLGLWGLVIFFTALFLEDSTSSTAIGLAGLYLGICAPEIRPVVKYLEGFGSSLVSLKAHEEFVNTTPKERSGKGIDVPADWPARGHIEFRDVTARYSSDMPSVLSNISLVIQPNEKVCFFGRTGGGKTSLLLALLGFLDYSGEIIIDGIDVATIQPDILRSRIITISQDQVQLDGTIRDNLLPYKIVFPENSSDQDRRDIVEDLDAMATELLSDLGAWDKISEAGGLDGQMEKADFSKGMLQIICFARAVLRYHHTKGKIVVIDEATSSMDTWQDAAVQEAMWEFFEGCTILQVAHLQESIKDAELSVELSEGRILHTRIGSVLPPGVETRGRDPTTPASVIASLDSNATSPNRRIRPSVTGSNTGNHSWGYAGFASTAPGQDSASSSYLTSSGYLTSSADSTSSSYLGSSSSYNQEQPQLNTMSWEDNVMPSIEGNDFESSSGFVPSATGRYGSQSVEASRAPGAPGSYVATEIANYWPIGVSMESEEGSGMQNESEYTSNESSSAASDDTSRPNNPPAMNTFMFH